MKVALYKGTRPGYAGIGNVLVRLRTKSPYSHSEIIFEPSDGPEVAALMPDGNLEPDADGAVWCYSATATDKMPDWGPDRNYRAGRTGGTRFKRIKLDEKNWDIKEAPFADPVAAAKKARREEGKAYDWRHIFSFFNIVLIGVVINFFMNQGENHWTCAEVCGALLQFEKPEIFDPKTLGIVMAIALGVWQRAQTEMRQGQDRLMKAVA